MTKKRENIFDLSKIIGKSNDVEVKSVTQDHQTALVGYELVEEDSWDKILSNSHIRYLRTDGKFVNGGFVKSVCRTLDTNGKDTFKIDLVSNFTPKAIKWSIYKGNIDKLWKKIEVVSVVATHNADMTNMKEDMEFLKKSMDSLKIDLQNTKNELMRTVTLIKKLHKIG